MLKILSAFMIHSMIVTSQPHSACEVCSPPPRVLIVKEGGHSRSYVHSHVTYYENAPSHSHLRKKKRRIRHYRHSHLPSSRVVVYLSTR